MKVEFKKEDVVKLGQSLMMFVDNWFKDRELSPTDRLNFSASVSGTILYDSLIRLELPTEEKIKLLHGCLNVLYDEISVQIEVDDL